MWRFLSLHTIDCLFVVSRIAGFFSFLVFGVFQELFILKPQDGGCMIEEAMIT